MLKQTRLRYGSAAQAFHWVTALLVVVTFIYGPGGSETRVYASATDPDRRLHETLGVTIFALATLRLLWRAFDERPDPAEVRRWMHLASRTVQVLLYVLIFALPVTAVTGAWLEGHPLTLLGGMAVGPLLPLAHDNGARLATLHGWLGDAIMWLAGLHAAAAIFHHFVLRDGVLLSMLPQWFPLHGPSHSK